jgi:hypothetical protein
LNRFGTRVADASERCANVREFKPAEIREYGIRDVRECTSVRGPIWPNWVCDLLEPSADE